MSGEEQVMEFHLLQASKSPLSLSSILIGKMKIEKVVGLVSILVLLFMALPMASAHINVVDMGTGYDMIGHYGFVDYQNVANYTINGAILVFIDNEIVAGKILNMPIRYVAGFRCSPLKTLEFPLRMSKGDHTIVAYALSMNSSVERSYEYYAEDWWLDQEEAK